MDSSRIKQQLVLSLLEFYYHLILFQFINHSSVLTGELRQAHREIIRHVFVGDMIGEGREGHEVDLLCRHWVKPGSDYGPACLEYPTDS
jgi:hypothetical protein